MKTNILTSIFFSFYILTSLGQITPDEADNYLNQKPPGLHPQIFAPGLISTTEAYEFGSAFNREANTFYYGVRLTKDWKAEMHYTKLKNGKWTKTQRLELDTTYSYNDPYFSREGDKLYFISNRPLNGKGEAKDSDLWYIQGESDVWSDPINLGEVVNSSKDEYYISFSNSGTIYFVSNRHTKEDNPWDYDIYYSESSNGKFKPAVRMGESLNSESFECDPFIAADESYIIYCSSRPGGHGEGDLYISFKDENNQWSKAVNMGSVINTEYHEFCPVVTHDGKYFFFTSNGNIYWVDAQIIATFEGESHN